MHTSDAGTSQMQAHLSRGYPLCCRNTSVAGTPQSLVHLSCRHPLSCRHTSVASHHQGHFRTSSGPLQGIIRAPPGPPAPLQGIISVVYEDCLREKTIQLKLMDGLLPPVKVSFVVVLARDLLSPFLDNGIIRARG